jgi:hypothetical protein
MRGRFPSFAPNKYVFNLNKCGNKLSWRDNDFGGTNNKAEFREGDNSTI